MQATYETTFSDIAVQPCATVSLFAIYEDSGGGVVPGNVFSPITNRRGGLL